MLFQKAFSACAPDIQLLTGNFGVQFVSNMKNKYDMSYVWCIYISSEFNLSNHLANVLIKLYIVVSKYVGIINSSSTVEEEQLFR